jgi:hypothetical protein
LEQRKSKANVLLGKEGECMGSKGRKEIEDKEF